MMIRSLQLNVIFLTACILIIARPLEASTRYGVSFADQIEVGEARMKLQGAGPKSYLFVRVFVAGFYLGEGVDSTQVLEDVPKKLEVHYFFKVPARQLAQETRRRIIINLTAEDFSKIESRVNVMDGYFVNLRPGDIYSLTYLPKIGTQFSLNGRVIGTIAGADFARGLFSVWFGVKPLDRVLKARLLTI